jgi:hypothetical protein
MLKPMAVAHSECRVMNLTDDAAGPSQSTWLKQLSKLNGPLVECKIELNNLETFLRRNIEHGLNNGKQTPLSLFDEINVQKTLDIVERLKVALNDADHMDQRYDIEFYQQRGGATDYEDCLL